MAVVVRLRRMGTTNKPYFRVVAADERDSNKGRFIETLGWYSPKKEGINYELDAERIGYWRKNGARTTNTVENLLKQASKQATIPQEAREETGQAEVSKTVRKVADLPPEQPSCDESSEANQDSDAQAEAVTPPDNEESQGTGEMADSSGEPREAEGATEDKKEVSQ